jgi:hypothetical protein
MTTMSSSRSASGRALIGKCDHGHALEGPRGSLPRAQPIYRSKTVSVWLEPPLPNKPYHAQHCPISGAQVVPRLLATEQATSTVALAQKGAGQERRESQVQHSQHALRFGVGTLTLTLPEICPDLARFIQANRGVERPR